MKYYSMAPIIIIYFVLILSFTQLSLCGCLYQQIFLMVPTECCQRQSHQNYSGMYDEKTIFKAKLYITYWITAFIITRLSVTVIFLNDKSRARDVKISINIEKLSYVLIYTYFVRFRRYVRLSLWYRVNKIKNVPILRNLSAICSNIYPFMNFASL